MIAAEKNYSLGLKEDINLTAGAVLRTLLYFDIFSYPLTVDEIHEYCNRYSTSKVEIEKELQVLEQLGYISKQCAFYYIKTDKMPSLVERRLKGNKKAEDFLRVAKKYSRFISFFPFVRGICLSGSLSKGYADNDSDIDYFIITQQGRLWICRTMLVSFKKLFLFNSHKYFCVNYFIDTNSLEIPDKNLFAATELLSIIPACNVDLYQKLMEANGWVKEYYPNGTFNTSKFPVLKENKAIAKKTGEAFFLGKLGDWIDDLCFKLTLSTWKRKFKDFNPAEFDLNLRTRKNVSKHHPNGFQLKVMKKYNERVRDFEQRFNINLGWNG